MTKIKFTTRAVKDLKNLKKKYRKIEEDIEWLLNELNEGKIGDRLQEFQDLEIYKKRIQNSSTKIGKSGGFRVIIYVKRVIDTFVILTIYSKNDKTNISKKEILEIMRLS